MRIVVLGGAGIIGQPIVRDLTSDVEEIVVADMDLDAAKSAAAGLGKSVIARQVDVTDEDALDKVLQGADACINSVNYYFNLQVMKGCLRKRVPYIDLGGLFHTTRDQLELHQPFEEAGVTAILGLGSCPGVANVQAGVLAAKLDTVESVKIYNGGTLDEGESLAWGYSIDTILDEISKPAMIFRDGEFREMPALGEEERYLFLDPIGYANTHLSLHSEVATIPLSFADKGIRECFFKITFFGYSEAALRKIQFLAQLGFASAEPVEVKGAKMAPRDMLIALLKQNAAVAIPPKNKGFKDVVTEVRGTKNGKESLWRMDTWATPSERMNISGGKLMIAIPPAVVARWLASRKLDRPGVWAPEVAISGALAQSFFEELSLRGIRSDLTHKQALSLPSR